MTSPVHVGRALESLRSSNFNTVSAMGEIIDNSIEAEAKNIRLKIKKIKNRKKYDFTEIAFSDDGIGMSKDILYRCLQLGFSERYNKRDGIGRFGVGMTLGAITQCTRIEVYSKPRGGEWNFTYLDLEEMKDQEDAEIPEPISKEIPRDYSSLVEDFGTLIIWKNWDREDATIDEMKKWIGRTYRKFIGQEIIRDGKVIPNTNQRHIFLDDGDSTNEISALDPLYATRTNYNSEVATLATPIILEEEVHKFDKPPEKTTGQKKITIQSSLLPKSWWEKPKTGNSTENNKRHVRDNEGISILRNDREVFYGHIPYYKIRDDASSHYKGFIDMDRFWGCEISFDAYLDHWFSVKNIKVGARPILELREKIQDIFNETIHGYRKEIRGVRKTYDNKLREETGGTVDNQDGAEEIIKDQNPESSDLSADEMEELLKSAGKIKDKTREILIEKLNNNPCVFHKNFQMDERGNFIDIVSRGGTTMIHLNMQHPFFHKFYDIIDKLKEKSSKDETTHEEFTEPMEKNLKLLLASFALAKNEFNMEQTQTARDFVDKLILNWTFTLGKHVKSTLEEKQDN